MLERAGEGLVSCLALQVFYDYVQHRGLDKRALQDGLPFDRQHLDRNGNWVDYSTLLEIEHRMLALFPGEPALFFDVGSSVGRTKSLGFLRTVTRVSFSPFTVYRRIPGLMRRFLFRFFTAHYEQVSWNRIHGTYEFQPGCPPSDAFLETARGVLTSAPEMVGAPPAHVAFTQVAPLLWDVEIVVRDWRSASQQLAGAWRGLVGWRGRQLAAQHDAVTQLEDTNRQLQAKIRALTDTTGELEQLRDTLAERVEQRTAELQVSQSQLADTVGRLRKAQQLRNKLLANVSHEWRTPLTMVKTPLEVALESLTESPDHPAVKPLTGALRAAATMDELVSEMLALTRSDSTEMTLDLGRFDLTAAVADTCAEVFPMGRDKALDCAVADDGEERWLQADEKLVRRAVLNLVGNAIKYCEPGDTVRVRLSDEAERFLIHVEDSGPGIAEHKQAEVFERFARGDAEGLDGVDGSGIGLAMVRDIAQAHGGDVQLKSTLGAGCHFAITLPQRAVDPPSIALADPSAPPKPTLPADVLEPFEPAPVDHPADAERAEHDVEGPREHRLLIVEDDDALRSFLADQLQGAYRVWQACDGAEGLAIAQRELPDLVLTDVNMPRMGGLALCRAIKEDPRTRNIAVVMLTGRQAPEATLEGFAAHADDYVTKPFRLRELQARIRTQLRLRELTMTLVRAEKQSMLSLLSAGIAHELLNPVNAVINGVPHVREFLSATAAGRPPRLDAETCAELLDAIEQGGKRIDATVRAVLTFTRSEDGPGRMALVRLSALIGPMLQVLQFKLRDIEVVQEHPFDEELLCHAELIDQAIANLVVNAADAVPARGGRIVIRVEQVGEEVLVRVKDNGPGVPAAMRERIFAPFFTTKDPGKGTGLGLGIGREIAAAHGGRLELLAGDGEGAEFALIVPLLRPDGERRDAH